MTSPNTIQVRVKFFGPPREAIGVREIELTLPRGATLAVLSNRLVQIYPDLQPHMRTMQLTINRNNNLDLETELHHTDQVACIPAVSGG